MVQKNRIEKDVLPRRAKIFTHAAIIVVAMGLSGLGVVGCGTHHDGISAEDLQKHLDAHDKKLADLQKQFGLRQQGQGGDEGLGGDDDDGDVADGDPRDELKDLGREIGGLASEIAKLKIDLGAALARAAAEPGAPGSAAEIAQLRAQIDELAGKFAGLETALRNIPRGGGGGGGDGEALDPSNAGKPGYDENGKWIGIKGKKVQVHAGIGGTAAFKDYAAFKGIQHQVNAYIKAGKSKAEALAEVDKTEAWYDAQAAEALDFERKDKESRAARKAAGAAAPPVIEPAAVTPPARVATPPAAAGDDVPVPVPVPDFVQMDASGRFPADAAGNILPAPIFAKNKNGDRLPGWKPSFNALKKQWDFVKPGL